ncbi:MAG: GIY-YIG nuclease family protein [Cyanobacteria bacterium SIG28]|nr:GIY-YIG nuclease family protein [Cyanobacteria bacterium SIG28]
MKIEQIFLKIEKRVKFDLASYRKLDKTCGCYILTTFDDTILYIGKTENFFERFQQHLKDPVKTSPTKLGKAFWFYYVELPLLDIDRFERTLLNDYECKIGTLPILNNIHSPVV